MTTSPGKTPYPPGLPEKDKARWDRADSLRTDSRLPVDGKQEAVRVMRLLALRSKPQPETSN